MDATTHFIVCTSLQKEWTHVLYISNACFTYEQALAVPHHHRKSSYTTVLAALG